MKILLIGLGGVGQRHARNLRALLGEDVELFAFRVRGRDDVITADLSIDDSTDVASRLGIRTFNDLDEALTQRPDAAIIANPTSLHVDVATRCARAGCDLFVEKPLADSLVSADQLIDLVSDRKLVAMVGYQLRFHPCIQRLREIVEGRMLGNLLSVRAVVGEHLPNWHRYENYRDMYAARADLGGGVVLSQIHEFDYLYSLFGAPGTIFSVGGHFSFLDVDVEDTASTLMECTVDGRPLAVHLLQDYLQYPSNRSCEVVGDRGRAVMDLVAPSISVWDEHGSVTHERFERFERNELFLAELEHFLACCATRARPIVDLVDGRESLHMALAAKESIRSGRAVHLQARSSSGEAFAAR